MRTIRWLVAAGLLASATGCVEMNGYPGTSYGGYPSGYGYSSGYGYPSSGYYGSNYGYYNQPTYYRPPPQVVTQTRYVPVPVATNNNYRSSWGGRDRNNNGVPDWKERDRNGDGVPDWQQRRGRSG